MSDEQKRGGSGARGGKPSFGRGNHQTGGAGKPQHGYKSNESGIRVGSRGAKTAFADGKSSSSGDKKPFTNGSRHSGGNHPAYGQKSRDFRGNKKPEKKAVPVEGMPARRMALAVIRQVTESGAYASLALDDKLVKSGLNPADRRLTSRLVYDTLEHLLTIDHALSQVMAKPDTDIKLRNILRLGACQILLEDRIPESAATNTCVELCRELGMDGLAGVCNGILRNLIRQKDALSWPDPEKEPVRALSIRHSVPEWLVERLQDDWGNEAEALMAAHEPESCITVHPNLTELDDESFEKLLEKKVWQHERGMVPHSWRIRGMADVGRDADFLQGRFSIQGESSMMACLALSPKRGAQVLDACAAPGGKACLLAEMMGGSGRVQAWELHPHRTELIAAQARRLHLENVRPMTRDASVHRADLDETMDAVLLDAPCSGLGVMADKPDVKYRVTPKAWRS